MHFLFQYWCGAEGKAFAALRAKAGGRLRRESGLGILKFRFGVATPNLVKLFQEFLALSTGLVGPAGFFVQVTLASNVGILQRISPAAQSSRGPFRNVVGNGNGSPLDLVTQAPAAPKLPVCPSERKVAWPVLWLPSRPAIARTSRTSCFAFSLCLEDWLADSGNLQPYFGSN